MADPVIEYATPKSERALLSRITKCCGWSFLVCFLLGSPYLFSEFFNTTYPDKNPWVVATLKTMRNQIDLFKSQHNGNPPAPAALASMLNGRSNDGDTSVTSSTGTLGPYIQSFPINGANSYSGVSTAPGKGIGWVYTVSGGPRWELYATDTTGTKLLSY